MHKLMTIRSRMTIAYLLLVAAVMLLTGYIVLSKFENYHLTVQEENLEQTGNLLAAVMLTHLHEGAGPHRLNTVAADFSQQINARVIVVDNNRVVRGDSHGGELVGSSLQRSELEEALQGRTGRSVQYSTLSRQQVLQVAIPLDDQNERMGAIFFAASLNPLYETLTAVRRLFIIATFFAMVLAVALGALFAQYLGGSIKELTAAARRMAAGQLDQKITITSQTGRATV